MPLNIHPATPRDSSALTTLFLAAFSNPFNLTLFPRTPDVRAWWEEKFAREATAPGRVLLKVVDTPDNAYAAFAIWKFPKYQSEGNQEQEEDGEEKGEGEGQWPRGSDPTLCERFFGSMAAKREEYMGSKPHYYLDMLGTHPSHNGKGIASMLLKWGLDRADNDGVPVFLSASPAGKPMYERRGFRVVQEEEVAGGHVQAYMVRD
ncbi:GNAT family N-acetyltransferase [Aspergillus glaucus CBS 516.65]|uniref:N-acetyltransferase domain-containing protein n=1 Tax=Aspergillus glaucus CBS 516.65 TaxID=1160497 RepID=A0A1L9VL30_ASPGL|nr:hypothetical protein ASPGLDRAFT_170476 [Aspergillus glaucus CBS 516.65]OJJ84639.1 hypothetical protein ASPGLDRAFT_170476 [Aspergillus glaucus CBS 516.65]